MAACQQAKVLKRGPADLIAVGVWSLIHGFISLVLEGQIPHTVLDQYALRELLILTLNQITLVDLKPEKFAAPNEA